jgi:hypothetical protein
MLKVTKLNKSQKTFGNQRPLYFTFFGFAQMKKDRNLSRFLGTGGISCQDKRFIFEKSKILITELLGQAILFNCYALIIENVAIEKSVVNRNKPCRFQKPTRFEYKTKSFHNASSPFLSTDSHSNLPIHKYKDYNHI